MAENDHTQRFSPLEWFALTTGLRLLHTAMESAMGGCHTHFLVHGHCHQKTLDGGRWTYRLLYRIPGAAATDSEACCYGMAGTFGYEAEHDELSRIIAGQRLLPRLDKISGETRVVPMVFPVAIRLPI